MRTRSRPSMRVSEWAFSTPPHRLHRPHHADADADATRRPTLPLVQPLQALPAVSCVYLEHNPLGSEVDYRERIKAMLPTLTQIDAIALPRR